MKSRLATDEIYKFCIARMTATYNQTTALYLAKTGKEGRRQVKRWKAVLNQTQDYESLLNSMELFHSEMIKVLKGEIAPPTQPEDQDDGPQPYDNLSLSQRRGRYLAEYCEKNKIKSLKTSEARHILQTVEKIRLKPTQIIRALHEASKWLNSTLDHVGGRLENRLKIIQPTIIKEDRFFNHLEVKDPLRSNYYSG